MVAMKNYKRLNSGDARYRLEHDRSSHEKPATVSRTSATSDPGESGDDRGLNRGGYEITRRCSA